MMISAEMSRSFYYYEGKCNSIPTNLEFNDDIPEGLNMSIWMIRKLPSYRKVGNLIDQNITKMTEKVEGLKVQLKDNESVMATKKVALEVAKEKKVSPEQILGRALGAAHVTLLYTVLAVSLIGIPLIFFCEGKGLMEKAHFGAELAKCRKELREAKSKSSSLNYHIEKYDRGISQETRNKERMDELMTTATTQAEQLLGVLKIRQKGVEARLKDVEEKSDEVSLAMKIEGTKDQLSYMKKIEFIEDLLEDKVSAS